MLMNSRNHAVHDTHRPPRTPARSRAFSYGRQVWTVWEDLTAAPNAEKPSLVFESAGIARRVHAYPANWYTLTDEELHALSWQR